MKSQRARVLPFTTSTLEGGGEYGKPNDVTEVVLIL